MTYRFAFGKFAAAAIIVGYNNHLRYCVVFYFCKMANALRKMGIKSGDSVIIYMAMTIEGIVAMQACAYGAITYGNIDSSTNP